MGIESFTEDFQQWILDTCVDEEYFQERLIDYMDSYIEAINDEESDHKEYESRLAEEMDDYGVDCKKAFLEALVMEVEDPVEWFKHMFGKDEFKYTCEEVELIDWEAVINKAIGIDGRGHFIATYDGEENEVGEYFIYRLN